MAQREGAEIRTRSSGTRQKCQGPVRTCVGCRTQALAAELLRVVAEDGRVERVAVPDPRRRHPGRGAWLHLDSGCLRLAQRRRAFPRALRVPGNLDITAVQHHIEQVAREMTGAGNPAAGNEGSRSTRHESAVKLKP